MEKRAADLDKVGHYIKDGVAVPLGEEFHLSDHNEKSHGHAGIGESIKGAYEGVFKDDEFEGKKISGKILEKSFRKATKDLVDPEQRKAERNEKIKKALVIAGAVALAAGVVFLGIKVNEQQKAAVGEIEARAAKHEIESQKSRAGITRTRRGEKRRQVHLTRRFEATDKQGRRVQVIDSTGKLTEKQATGLLRQLVQSNNDANLEGRPARLQIHNNHNAAKGSFGFVNVKAGTRGINMNYEPSMGQSWGSRLARFASRTPGAFSSVAFNKNARHGGDPARYTVSHEMGHIVDMDGARKTGTTSTSVRKYNRPKGSRRIDESPSYTSKRNRIFSRWARRPGVGLSNYGNSNQYEGYAESYAEWHLSGGKTRSAAARDYATEFGWKRF